MKTLIEAMASTLDAMRRVEKWGDQQWAKRHLESLRRLEGLLPHGSGLDDGVKLDLEKSSPDRLVFHATYYRMTEGYYDGWTKFTIIVKPSFVIGMDIRVQGGTAEDKEYVCQRVMDALNQEV